ncbi:YceH family protein [Noviherbaspirillum sp. ST9]|uniref:YceH family protein n=1 Tax=Noviherbaspirillum sp. ST9 TaxID=3401606 RepID=UPI003B586198
MVEFESNEGSATTGGGDLVLDAVEVRVLGVLAEKEALTPDNYPLSVNALTNGCNQLTSRDPVMSVSEDVVLDTLQRLIQKKLVSEVRQAGARVSKYEHRMRMKWSLEQDKLAVLALLMLRGMQTAGEIRARSGRLHDFAAVTDVEAGLQFLIDKYPPLVARLPRALGEKEVRYMHLLSGEEIPERVPDVVTAPVTRQDRIAELESEVAQLRAEVARLGEQFDSFRKQFD